MRRFPGGCELGDLEGPVGAGGEVQVRDGARVAVVRTGEGTGARFYRVRRR